MGRRKKPDAMTDAVRASNYRERLRQQVSANRKQAETVREILAALTDASGANISITVPELTGDATTDAGRLLEAVRVAQAARGLQKRYNRSLVRRHTQRSARATSAQ